VNGKKARAEKLVHDLSKNAVSFQKTIQKEDLINYAKEKGLYVDPNTLNDKQKKDPKFMAEVNLELTPAVLAKAYKAFVSELELKLRKVSQSD
jgi:hypothetical protein